MDRCKIETCSREMERGTVGRREHAQRMSQDRREVVVHVEGILHGFLPSWHSARDRCLL